MGLLSQAQGYTPKENQEFGGKKKLVGDAVCQVKLEKIISKKNQKEWIILKGEAIHILADDKGRPVTLEAGDEISRFYDGSDDESVQELMDDLFTAGIKFTAGLDDESTFANMKAAVDEKLVYFRTWAKDKDAAQLAKNPVPSYYQNIKILSASKINADNSVPQVAF